MHCAEFVTDWYSTSPLWRPALSHARCGAFRPIYGPHFRPLGRKAAFPRVTDPRPCSLDWLSGIKTDFVWVFASPVIGSQPAPAPWDLPANKPAGATLAY